jgi:hypothetical protein
MTNGESSVQKQDGVNLVATEREMWEIMVKIP